MGLLLLLTLIGRIPQEAALKVGRLIGKMYMHELGLKLHRVTGLLSLKLRTFLLPILWRGRHRDMTE